MATTIQELSVLVGADLSGYQRGMQSVRDGSRSAAQAGGLSLDGISQSLNRVGDSASKLAGNLAGVFLPAGAALGWGISVASDFESTLTEIEVRAGLTADGIDDIREASLALGADTAFSAQQAADAYLQLLTSGSTVEEALATLPSVLDAAAASGEDLGQTADVITDIMAAFQLSAGVFEDGSSYSQMVVDALAQAAGASSATMGSLGEGFANVGGQARAFGLSVEDTAAVLAIFSENGIKGAEAGTALRSMLTNMTRETKDVKAAWQALGTSFYDQAGNIRPLQDVLEDIRLGLDGKTEQQQNQILQDLAGTYGILGLRAALGATSIDEMLAKMHESATASEVADARMDTFSGTVDSLKGSIETFMITAGTPFIENVLQPIAAGLTDAVNKVTEWADENPELVSSLMGVVLAGAIAVPVLWGISAVARAVSSGIGLISGAVAFLGGPASLLLLGAVGAFVLLNTEVGKGVTVFDVLMVAVNSVMDDIKRRFDIAGLDIQIWAADARARIADIFNPEEGARIRVEELTPLVNERALYGVGDQIYSQLQQQMDESIATGDPFTITPELAVQIQQDPNTLATKLGYDTRLLLVGAWNRASEQGDLDFLQDAAPLMISLANLNLLPDELGDFDVSRLRPVMATMFTEALSDMGGTVLTPVGTWDMNVQNMRLNLLNLGADPAMIQAEIDAARVTAALNLAVSDTGAVDLSVPVVIQPVEGDLTQQRAIHDYFVRSLEAGLTAEQAILYMPAELKVLPSSEVETISLESFFSNMQLQPAMLETFTANATAEVRRALTDALIAAQTSGDGASYQLLASVAVEMGVELDSIANTAALNAALEENELGIVQMYVDVLPQISIDAEALEPITVQRLTEAITNRDYEAIDVLTPLAVALGIDVEAIRRDAASQITTAIETATPTPVDADLATTAIINGPDVVSQVTTAIQAQNYDTTVTSNVTVLVNEFYENNPEFGDRREGYQLPVPDGSHAWGLERVPFDGYVSELHEDEAVLTAPEAAVWRRMKAGGFAMAGSGHGAPLTSIGQINISTYGEAPDELARLVARRLRDQSIGGGMFGG